MKKTETRSQNFEASLASLEKIVRELERGDQPLEQSLELFERGVRLSRECQERLNEAERRIEVLLHDADGNSLVRDFDEVNFGRAGAAATTTTDDTDEDDESVF